MQITFGLLVDLNYKIYAEDEDPSKVDEQFMRIVYGSEPLPRILEKELYGKEKDFKFSVKVSPEESFGAYDKNLVNRIPLATIRHPERLKKDEYYREETIHGNIISFKVLEIGDDYVVADFNHPLAGKHMIIEGRVLDVRKPTIYDLLHSYTQLGYRRGG